MKSLTRVLIKDSIILHRKLDQEILHVMQYFMTADLTKKVLGVLKTQRTTDDVSC